MLFQISNRFSFLLAYTIFQLNGRLFYDDLYTLAIALKQNLVVEIVNGPTNEIVSLFETAAPYNKVQSSSFVFLFSNNS